MSSEHATLSLVPSSPRDEQLVAALRSGQRWAPSEVYGRYGPVVRRLLVRSLGLTADVDDLTQEVFSIVFADIAKLREPSQLRAWLVSIAVQRLRKFLRSKARWAWLRVMPASEVPDVAAAVADEDARHALRATYALIDRLGPDERIAFTLRHLEQLSLEEIAAACDVSLATVKRRLRSAQDFFERHAAAHPQLSSWFHEGAA